MRRRGPGMGRRRWWWWSLRKPYAENSVFLRYDAESLGDMFPAFRRNRAPLRSRVFFLRSLDPWRWRPYEILGIDHTVMVRHIPKEEIPRQRCCEHVKTEQNSDKNGDCYSNGCFCKQKLIIWSNILSSEVSVSCLATVINALWGYVVQTFRDTCYAFSYPVTPLCNFLCPALKWCNKNIKQDSLEVFYVVWKHGKVERRRRFLSHCRKCG